jgi:type II secretory pathway component PulC
LEGIVVSANPSSSVALVRRLDMSRGRSLQVGESAFGVKLLEVLDGEAVFERDGIRFRLLLGGGQAPPPPVVADQPEESSGGRRGKTTEWVLRELERSEADERIEKEMPVILSETALVPRVAEGEVRGLVIVRLPDGTILSEAGLLPGDVLLSINELPMNGFSALVNLYPRLRSEDEIRVVVERDGKIMKLAYSFH